VKLRFVSVR